MDINNFRPEIHVAQQSRRDRLRILHQASGHHSVAFTSDVNQLPSQDGLTYETAPRNYQQCEPSGFCSEINHFPELGQRNRSIAYQELENNFSTDVPAANFNHVSDCSVINRETQPYFTMWKSTGSQSTTDTCLVAANQGSNLVSGSGLPGVSSSSPRIIHGETSTAFPTSDVKSRLQTGDIHCNPSSLYHNQLEELVCTTGFATVRPLSQKSSEGTSHGPWAVDGADLLLLSGLKGPHDLISRPVGANLWNGGSDQFALAKDGVHNTQGLALSLSSVPSSKVHVTMFAEGDMDSKGVLGNMNSSVGDKVSGNARQGASMVSRSPCPLGPFTGYATILRSSRFLRPAQVVLEEFCCMARPVNNEIYEGLDKILEEDRVSGEDDGEPGIKAIAGPLFGFNGSNEKSREVRGTSGWMNSWRPENFQKKAKLLYMQDEVSKRYKQYHQQMQMVVSSFESVAGLSAATPYISLALKMVSKNFRCLKNSITDQLKSIRGAMGEEPSPPSAGTTNGGASGSMLKFFDQSFQKQRGANNAGLLQSPHVWRPQRGLPERAVSILRAWLFEHFLHPYPTDTDKHMLAAQTGLTRNQVSNWFINARVRVWKPMVEEIHTLETKGNSDTCTDGKTAAAVCSQLNDTAGQCSNTLRRTSYSSLDPTEKRSRKGYHHVSNSASLFVASDGVEIPGLGPVSLTLGLRQSAEHGRLMHYGDGVIREDLLADF